MLTPAKTSVLRAFSTTGLVDRVGEGVRLLVRRTGAMSLSTSDHPIFVTPGQPGVFTQNTSGAGPGSILDANSALVSEQNPISRVT